MRIYLTGFMGVGKSTIGITLAEHLQYPFLDTDKYIESQTLRPIRAIFAAHGEVYFRRLETDCLRDTLHLDNVVVATGGGLPCFNHNMDWIKQKGVSIFLRATPMLLAQRLIKEKFQRPLLANLQENELITFIENRLIERHMYYSQSDYTIQIQQKEVNDIIEEIVALIM